MGADVRRTSWCGTALFALLVASPAHAQLYGADRALGNDPLLVPLRGGGDQIIAEPTPALSFFEPEESQMTGGPTLIAAWAAARALHLDEAASHFVSFAEEVDGCRRPSPRCADARAALEAAAYLRRALGESEAVERLLDRHLERFAHTYPRDVARVELGRLPANREFERAARAWRRRFGARASLEARAWLAQRRAATLRARGAHRDARAAARGHRASAAADEALTPEERCALAAVALERVQIRLAELRATTLSPPADTSPRSVDAWAQTQFVPWLRRADWQVRLIRTRADEVLDLACAPTSVAGIEAVGAAYEHMLDMFRAMSEAVAPPDELEMDYVCRDASASELLGYRVEDAYEACLGLARETRTFGPASQRCAAGLDRMRGGAYPPPEEIVERAEWSPLAVRALPIPRSVTR